MSTTPTCFIDKIRKLALELCKSMTFYLHQVIDLNVGELQMYGTVTWLNALDELGKLKKGIELLCMVFVFKAGIVLLAQERNKLKKKGNKVRSWLVLTKS